MSIKPGDFVSAESGRDKGKCFMVLSVENQFLYLCDGKNRQVINPKKKKIKHISFAGDGYESIRTRIEDGIISDRDIRRSLSLFKGYITAESDIYQ